MGASGINRKLAAIFYADVAGYSRLTGADEEGTHRRVMAMLDRVADKIGGSSGTVLRYAGDAILATFPSVIDAVNCATDVQTELDAANRGLDEMKRVEIRIGINLGDVIEDRGEVYGDGVNLVARLEAAAAPGGICLSGAAFDQVQGKIGVEFVDGGDESFKNIERPVRVWRWRPSGGRSAEHVSGSSNSGSAHEPPALAVLPFTNMSGDPEQEYFSDGLTEDIITALSHWRSMPVIARNSTFIYKGRSVSITEVARELGVRYVLEGSVRRGGNRLRITAQLVDGDTGHHVWAEKFDRELADIFDVQDEITHRIAATIVPEVEQFETRRAASKRPQDLDAWDLYLQGLEGFFSDDCEGLSEAIRLYGAAVEKDPGFGDAWARFGWCHVKLVMQGCVDEPAETMAKAFEACRKAIKIEPMSALANLALGTAHIWAEETEEGTEWALKAVDLNPNYTEALYAAGNRLDLIGRTEEGVAMLHRGLALSPRDPARWRYLAYLSRACAAAGDLEEALDWAKQSVALRPELAEAQFRYAIVLALADRVEAAKAALERADAIKPGYVAGKADWRPYPDDERNERIMAGLRRHGLV